MDVDEYYSDDADTDMYIDTQEFRYKFETNVRRHPVMVQLQCIDVPGIENNMLRSVGFLNFEARGDLLANEMFDLPRDEFFVCYTMRQTDEGAPFLRYIITTAPDTTTVRQVLLDLEPEMQLRDIASDPDLQELFPNLAPLTTQALVFSQIYLTKTKLTKISIDTTIHSQYNDEERSLDFTIERTPFYDNPRGNSMLYESLNHYFFLRDRGDANDGRQSANMPAIENLFELSGPYVYELYAETEEEDGTSRNNNFIIHERDNPTYMEIVREFSRNLIIITQNANYYDGGIPSFVTRLKLKLFAVPKVLNVNFRALMNRQTIQGPQNAVVTRQGQAGALLDPCRVVVQLIDSAFHVERSWSLDITESVNATLRTMTLTQLLTRANGQPFDVTVRSANFFVVPRGAEDADYAIDDMPIIELDKTIFDVIRSEVVSPSPILPRTVARTAPKLLYEIRIMECRERAVVKVVATLERRGPVDADRSPQCTIIVNYYEAPDSRNVRAAILSAFYQDENVGQRDSEDRVDQLPLQRQFFTADQWRVTFHPRNERPAQSGLITAESSMTMARLLNFSADIANSYYRSEVTAESDVANYLSIVRIKYYIMVICPW